MGLASLGQYDRERCGQLGTEPGSDSMRRWTSEASHQREHKESSETGAKAGALQLRGFSGEKMVAPRTKPQPRWCLVGLTKMQLRHVQKMQAQELKEREREAQQDGWFN
jgi:hypothetical protein